MLKHSTEGSSKESQKASLETVKESITLCSHWENMVEHQLQRPTLLDVETAILCQILC